jgi:hypothetical protein
VLHTHTRALDFHPHVHIVLPPGAINTTNPPMAHQAQQVSLSPESPGQGLPGHMVPGHAGAQLARHGHRAQAVGGGLHPRGQWREGTGLSYLARYLYRGVLSEKYILCCDAGQVTFRYTDNRGASQTRTRAGADFLWRLRQHVLPKGWRRTRDYGFLHANRMR